MRNFVICSLFFEDQGECGFLRTQAASDREKILHFLFAQIRTQFEYRMGTPWDSFQYRTRGGAFVPLAFRTKEGILGIIPLEDSSESVHRLSSAHSFLRTYSQGKILMLHPGVKATERKQIDSRIFIGPVGEFI